MKAIDYIRKGWTKGYFSRNSQGVGVSWNSSEATSWCAIGALLAAYPNSTNEGRMSEQYEARKKVYRTLREHFNTNEYISITTWNDDPNTTKEEILHVFEMAGV